MPNAPFQVSCLSACPLWRTRVNRRLQETSLTAVCGERCLALRPAEFKPPASLPRVIERRGKPLLVELERERVGHGDHEEAPGDDVLEAPGALRHDRVELGHEHDIDHAFAGIVKLE